MKSRIITGVALTLLVIAVLLLSHFPIVLNIAIACLSAQSIFEFYRATSADKKPIKYISYAIALLVSFMPHKIPPHMILALLVMSIGIFGYLMCRVQKMQAINKPLSVCLAMIILAFFKTVSYIRTESGGIYLLAFAIVIPILTDTGAYFIGRSIGKHKFAPNISPNKTVEGSIGGTLTALIFTASLAAFLDGLNLISVNYGWLVLYTAVISIIGQFGDLAFSSVKRIVGIKDYGKLLPGHGGILDRVDSILFALPTAYLLTFVMKIIV